MSRTMTPEQELAVYNGPHTHRVTAWMLRGAATLGLAMFGTYIGVILKVLT